MHCPWQQYRLLLLPLRQTWSPPAPHREVSHPSACRSEAVSMWLIGTIEALVALRSYPHCCSGIGLVYCQPKLVQESEQAENWGYIYSTTYNHLSLCSQVLLLALCWCLPDPSLSQFNSLSLQKTKPATRHLACFHVSEFNQPREEPSDCQGQSKERSRYVAPSREES